MSLPLVKANYAEAAKRMAAFSLAAGKNGRAHDAALLEVACRACLDAAEFAPESVGPAAAAGGPQAKTEKVSAEAPAVCCLCEGLGKLVPGGWLCPNRRCPRYGVPLPRGTFEGLAESPAPRLTQPEIPPAPYVAVDCEGRVVARIYESVQPVPGEAREPRQDRAGEGVASQRPDTRENA